jgi:hypothetical protein
LPGLASNLNPPHLCPLSSWELELWATTPSRFILLKENLNWLELFDIEHKFGFVFFLQHCVANWPFVKQKFNSIHWVCKAFALVSGDVQNFRCRISFYLLVAISSTNWLPNYIKFVNAFGIKDKHGDWLSLKYWIHHQTRGPTNNVRSKMKMCGWPGVVAHSCNLLGRYR